MFSRKLAYLAYLLLYVYSLILFTKAFFVPAAVLLLALSLDRVYLRNENRCHDHAHRAAHLHRWALLQSPHTELS